MICNKCGYDFMEHLTDYDPNNPGEKLSAFSNLQCPVKTVEARKEVIVLGGPPNKGTKKDGRLKENKPAYPKPKK